MKIRGVLFSRGTELVLILVVALVALLGFTMVSAAGSLREGTAPAPLQPNVIVAPVVLVIFLLGIHWLLKLRSIRVEQLILPLVGMLFSLGLIMIWRLNGASAVWQQMLRGFIPGMLVIGALLIRPIWIEKIRRWAIPISAIGLLLPILTAVFGVQDETGVRLALKIGPFPAIQVSEILKVVLIIFLAWYIEREGREAEGRALVLFGGLRLPAIRYFLPGILFVALSTMALVQMSDFGAVLILGFIFIGMLFAGFETRVFITVAAIGAVLAVLVGLVLLNTWEIPTVIQYRFLAFQNPWSNQALLVNGQPTGVTVSSGPGYQVQQAIYAIIAGGLTGTGLGYGNPNFVPLAVSDFIFAAIVEEMGGAVAIAILAFFLILLFRIFRIAILLPRGQLFEKLLLIGFGIHLFTQILIMVGGALNLLPLTGVTIPFMSLGGVALFTNLFEIGVALALAQRLEARPL